MATLPIEHVRRTVHVDIDDGDIAWVIQVFHSRDQLQWCVPFLREHYPRSRVVVISDGDDEAYEDIGEQYGLDVRRGEHLMSLASSHLYVERLLRAFLEGSEAYCLRLDPDARVWRRFRELPAFSSLFGTLETITEGLAAEIRVPANVQGGCLGLTRDAVAAIVESGLLSREMCVTRRRETWVRCDDIFHWTQRGHVCDDHILSWAAYQLGIPIVESAEIRSRWRRTVANEDRRYAVTHPHKLDAAGPLPLPHRGGRLTPRGHS